MHIHPPSHSWPQWSGGGLSRPPLPCRAGRLHTRALCQEVTAEQGLERRAGPVGLGAQGATRSRGGGDLGGAAGGARTRACRETKPKASGPFPHPSRSWRAGWAWLTDSGWVSSAPRWWARPRGTCSTAWAPWPAPCSGEDTSWALRRLPAALGSPPEATVMGRASVGWR